MRTERAHPDTLKSQEASRRTLGAEDPASFLSVNCAPRHVNVGWQKTLWQCACSSKHSKANVPPVAAANLLPMHRVNDGGDDDDGYV